MQQTTILLHAHDGLLAEVAGWPVHEFRQQLCRDKSALLPLSQNVIKFTPDGDNPLDIHIITANWRGKALLFGRAIMTPMFAACQKFDPRCGDSWSRYIEWSGFRHISELVSTDPMLCPPLIDTLIDADWEYNIHADNRVYFFHDYEYLKRRISYDASRHNLLAISERPNQTPHPIDGFTFCGYDILDSDDSISVLTNCGAFPSIYTADDLNQFGLVTELDRVTKIAENNRDANADDHHCCDCRVWEIARYTTPNNNPLHTEPRAARILKSTSFAAAR